MGMPLKWVCMEFGVYGEFGVCGEFIELVEGSMEKEEGTATLNNTYQMKLHVPPF